MAIIDTFIGMYYLEGFEFMTYRRNQYVVYGVGTPCEGSWYSTTQWHGRLPDTPAFGSVDEAEAWLDAQRSKGVYVQGTRLPGHSRGRDTCSKCCRGGQDRRVKGITRRFEIEDVSDGR